jgi:hypothetical protein
MNQFYSLDRKGLLLDGKEIGLVRWSDVDPPMLQEHLDSLFPDGVSNHGDRHLVTENAATDLEPNIELVFEYVRRAQFPHRPSRYQSVFACRTVEDVVLFRNEFGQPSDSIWLLEADDAFDTDMRFLTLGGSALVVSWFAQRYWQGDESDMPLRECLLVPPVTVVHKVE